MILKLSELFLLKTNQQFYTKKELCMLKLNTNFIKNLENLLKLTYVENTISKGNLCYANNSEVQPEFRTIFTKKDIVFYISTVLNKSTFEVKKDKIQLPTNVVNFFETGKR